MAEDITRVIEMFKTRLSTNEQKCARLRNMYPSLEQNDVRTQILERMWHVGMAALACYVAQRDHFSNGRWWKDHVGFAVLPKAGSRWNQTIGTFIKLGWIVQSFSMMESGFRVLLLAINNGATPINFNGVTKALLEKTRVTPTDAQRNALRLFQITRNTVHNNGTYAGSREENLTFEGHKFGFVPGMKVEYADFSIFMPMMDTVEDLIPEIISSEKMRTIQTIADKPVTLPGIKPITAY